MLWDTVQTKFNLKTDGGAAVDELKKLSINPLILNLPKTDQPFTVEADACGREDECDLLHAQHDAIDLRPVGYLSRSCNDTDRQYDTAPRRCFTVNWAVMLLKLHLEESRSAAPSTLPIKIYNGCLL